jgi:hypothetical protein
MLLAFVSICYAQAKNLDFAQINDGSPEEKKALLNKIPILKLRHFNLFYT